ncbi:MAG: hypothetical protein RIG61_11440 [Deltaproteobacteria bacterium]
MNKVEEPFAERVAEIIILISSLVIIAFMITGGCEGSGGASPTPQPATTGFPPECDGTFDIDLSCPATSLAGSVCLPYICDIIDDSTEIPEIVDNITIVFGKKCTDTDCFRLECEDLKNESGTVAEEASIVIESVNDTPVGEDVEGQESFGFPKGAIFIGGEEFFLDCNSAVVP